jgi:GT2 family glycosyltransferase
MNAASAPPRVLVVIVNWNKAGMLRDVLASLRTLGGTPFDILVVDNASTDGSQAMVRSEFPEATLLAHEENLGGTGGFNAGLRWGLRSPNGYEFIWLLDNDVIVHHGALDELLKPALADPEVGIVGSMLLNLDDENYVQEFAPRLNPWTGGITRHYEGPIGGIRRPQLVEADYQAACSLLVRVEALREVGIWDPNYFVLWDDIEWGVRMKRAGWRIVCTTESLVRHENFDNRRGRSALNSLYLGARNLLYGMHQLSPPWMRPVCAFNIARLTLTLAANSRESGRHAAAEALERGLADFLAGRMGAPPRDLAKPDAPPPPASEPVGVRRVALLARDNPEFVRQIHGRLRERFAGASIDTLVIGTAPALLAAGIPNTHIAPIDTAFSRLRLALRLRGYDAVAAPVFLPHFLFERIPPLNLRFRDDLSVETRVQPAGALPRMLAGRIGIIAKAFAYGVRAMLRPPRAVNYHDF